MAAVYLHYSVVQSPQGNKSEKTFLLLLPFLIVCRGGLDPQCEKQRERESARGIGRKTAEQSQ